MAEPEIPETHRRRSSQSRARVSRVEMNAFRGVPGSLEVVLRDGNNRDNSAIIFGENGSGKSTIVDAVEWACQKSVGRKRQLRGSEIPSLINLAADDSTCSVQVTLSTGEVIRRWATFSDDVAQVFGDRVPEIFTRAPMSLKRADILCFLDTPAVKRGSLFLDHALGNRASFTPTLTTDQMAVFDERLEAKRLMRNSAAKLAELIGVSPPPRDANDIEQMIAKDIYKGVIPRDRVKITLPRPVEKELDEFKKHRSRIRELNKLAKTLQVPTSAALERLKAMQSILSGAGDWLTTAFLSVTDAGHIARIEPVFGRISDVSLEIDVVLSNGAVTSPRKIFSEGYQDLVALLYFLAVARAAGEHGQARVLILDDVLQSVDANIRVTVMELLVRDFLDWQLLVTVHDRLWRSQLRDIFQRMGHPVIDVEVRQWNFKRGPHVITDAMEPAGALWSALDSLDPFMVCGVAGRLVEQICDRLSWTIPSSVKRKRGDSYTLADLWPGVFKELKRTSCAASLMDVDRWLHLRNMAGAHYNEWAEGITWTEAESFGYAVLEFYSRVRCSSCGQWVERRGKEEFSCRCSATTIQGNQA
jgi:RecF/RecN/SMC N terminal domain